mmetsp:Transcript_74040/g.193162  ORF Transcript_74040/g.193162 Transcript_74040/m.193162 type:complete len:244 (-) Transcript_74040:778-1509(-)
MPCSADHDSERARRVQTGGMFQPHPPGAARPKAVCRTRGQHARASRRCAPGAHVALQRATCTSATRRGPACSEEEQDKHTISEDRAACLDRRWKPLAVPPAPPPARTTQKLVLMPLLLLPRLFCWRRPAGAAERACGRAPRRQPPLCRGHRARFEARRPAERLPARGLTCGRAPPRPCPRSSRRARTSLSSREAPPLRPAPFCGRRPSPAATCAPPPRAPACRRACGRRTCTCSRRSRRSWCS